MDRKRIATLGLGYLGNTLLGRVIDWGVDPLITFLLFSHIGGMKGFLFTWIALSVVSFFVCYALIVFYDWSKTDWLGIESVKALKELENRSGFQRIVVKLLESREGFAVVGLSIISDPFIVLAYMRHGANQYNGLTKRDWRIFLVSIVIANGWETILLYGGMTGARHIWKMIV